MNRGCGGKRAAGGGQAPGPAGGSPRSRGAAAASAYRRHRSEGGRGEPRSVRPAPGGAEAGPRRGGGGFLPGRAGCWAGPAAAPSQGWGGGRRCRLARDLSPGAACPGPGAACGGVLNKASPSILQGS